LQPKAQVQAQLDCKSSSVTLAISWGVPDTG
jgi:hypothetical protein